MFGIQQKLNGNVLTVTINLDGNGHISRTGKSKVIASTEGNVSVEGRPEIKLGINVYKGINA